MTAPRAAAGVGPLGAVAIGLWLLGCAAGFAALYAYSFTPGPQATAPPEWPEASDLARAPDRATLLVFLHPQCSCSAATLGELAKLLAQVPPERVTAHALLLDPADQPPAWTQGALWAQAAAIPGLTPRRDPDGVLAARFGAQTSGAVLLFDRAGRLRYNGGVTAARAHHGDTLGGDTLRALIRGEGAPPASAGLPTFGCELQDDACDPAPPPGSPPTAEVPS